MAQQGILWNLVSGIDPLGQYSKGLQQNQQRQTVLEQLAGQREDRQFSRERDSRNFEWQQQEAQRNQGNWEKQFGQNAANQNAMRSLQQQQFELQKQTANTAQIVMVEQADGTKAPVRVDRAGNVQPLNTGVASASPANPFAPAGKVTDEQAKASGYANRMAASNDVIRRLENINDGVSGFAGGVISNVAPTASNAVVSADRQQFNQAQRDFINATLRRESGAVISDAEFANARQQYFPQPGDSKEVLAQKAQNRVNTMQGIMGAAGRTYQPPQNYRPQQTQGAVQEGATATNPQTNQKIQFRNGQWVPAQ